MTRRLRLEAFASEVKAAKRRAGIIDRYRMSACRERFSGGRAAPGQRIWAAASGAQFDAPDGDDSNVWKAIEALAQFIEGNYEGEGCYGALGTGFNDPSEDSAAIKLLKSMDLPSLAYA